MKKLCNDVVSNPDRFSIAVDGINVPPPLSSQFVHPSKEEAVAKYSKRFNEP
jgi:hypothetical protein